MLFSNFEEVCRKYYFSNTVCFHLNRRENGNCKARQENSKTSYSRASYLDLKLFICVKKFEFYPLTYSPFKWQTDNEQYSFHKQYMLHFRDTFVIFDKDGDGTIDTRELSTVLRAMGFNPTKVKKEQFFFTLLDQLFGSSFIWCWLVEHE